jgi:hypothetical protein
VGDMGRKGDSKVGGRNKELKYVLVIENTNI